MALVSDCVATQSVGSDDVIVGDRGIPVPQSISVRNLGTHPTSRGNPRPGCTVAEHNV